MIALLLFLAVQPKPEEFEIVLDEAKSVKMKFVKIKAGPFTMGEGKQRRRVELSKDFWMQTTEVTQAQWTALMGKSPSYFFHLENADELPVDQISWDDARKFIEKVSEKLKDKKAGLPTEAEWEFACRAGTETKWSFGDDKSKLEHHAWFDNNSVAETHPTAKKKPNPWGLYDMHGNVWEWCQDWHGDPGTGEAKDPAGPDNGTERVVKGGGFEDRPEGTRSASRKGAPPSSISAEGANKEIGFRVVLR